MATFGDLGWGKAENRGQKAEGGKKRRRRDTIKLLTSNFTPSNFWYGISQTLYQVFGIHAKVLKKVEKQVFSTDTKVLKGLETALEEGIGELDGDTYPTQLQTTEIQNLARGLKPFLAESTDGLTA